MRPARAYWRLPIADRAIHRAIGDWGIGHSDWVIGALEHWSIGGFRIAQPLNRRIVNPMIDVPIANRRMNRSIINRQS
ncbi:MAG: hypothetical protein AB7Q16_24070, partial [Vicinamibacterales bacterium]